MLSYFSVSVQYKNYQAGLSQSMKCEVSDGLFVSVSRALVSALLCTRQPVSGTKEQASCHLHISINIEGMTEGFHVQILFF